MLPHAAAEPAIRAGFNLAGVPWAPRPALSIQAIAAHESAYGTYPGRRAGMPPTNWGANHCKPGEPGYRANDRRYEKGKGWVAFPACFAIPSSNAHGVALIIDFFKSRGALGVINQTPRKVAYSMARMGYYDPAGREQYAASLEALGREMVRTVPAYAGLSIVSSGPYVHPMLYRAQGAPGGVVRAGFLIGPETTKSYMRRVDVAYDSFNQDMLKAWLSSDKQPFPKEFFGAWQKQWGAWKDFFNGNIDDLLTGWTSAEWDETEKFETTLKDYRTKYTAFTNVQPSAPEPPKEQPGPSLSDSLGIPWNGLLIVGGLAAGAVIVSNLRKGR